MILLPELIIMATGFLLLISAAFSLATQKNAWLALLGVLLALIYTWKILPQSGALLEGRFAIDPLTSWFKLIILSAAFLTICLAEEDSLPSRSEFLSLLLFTLSGAMFLASSRDLVSMYVSLELATIPLFLLAAWTRDTRSGEGAVKYLITGALASALLLYGLGLLYGLTQNTSFTSFSQVPYSPLIYLSTALLIAGIGFKLTLFPFHMWAPDAYEGAPSSVAAFLSVGSKATGLVLAFHIFYRLLGSYIQDWHFLIALLASATMTLGNIAAIKQKNIKRFMAYSSISQAGYLLLGFLGTTNQEVSSMVYYLFVYMLTNLAAFAIITLHIRQSGKETMESFRGLSQSNPLLALSMMLALFGLAGIPPLSGFVGKLFLFNIAAKHGFYTLVAIAAVNSTISLYYYLGIIRQMYIEPSEKKAPLKASPLFMTGLTLATLGSVICGLVPGFYNSVSWSASQWLALVSHF